jgi:predicted RND superfamily exporter protein
MVGDSAMAYEMSQTFSGEMNFITILTMLAIFAVVVCTFKSFFVSMLLVLVIQCAVYIVMAYLSLTGSRIFFIALIIVQSILMGATIDYAILFTSYYVENRSYFKMSIRDALINTYNRSINAILTSASILIIVTAIVGNLATAIAAAVCQAISLGTFCATLIILVLLPALLATLDKFVIKDSRNKVAKTDKGVRKLLAGFKSLL